MLLQHYGSAVYMNGLCLLCKQCGCVQPMLSLSILYVYSCSWCRASCARYWTYIILLYLCSVSSVITLIEHSEASTTKHKIIMWRKTERLHEIEFKRNEWYTISHCAANLKYLFVSWCCACKAAGYHRRGNRRKGTSNWVWTRDLCSNAEFQPHEVWNQSYSFVSHSCVVTVDSTSETVTKGEMGDKGAWPIP